MTWTAEDVHEALVRWGQISARLADGGLGYPSQSAVMVQLRQQPCRALEPTELCTEEYHALEAAIQQLPEPLRVVVLCYYKPGHLRARWPAIEPDGKGRARCPSLRALAAFLLVSKDVIALRLRTARASIADHLTRALSSDRITTFQ